MGRLFSLRILRIILACESNSSRLSSTVSGFFLLTSASLSPTCLPSSLASAVDSRRRDGAQKDDETNDVEEQPKADKDEEDDDDDVESKKDVESGDAGTLRRPEDWCEALKETLARVFGLLMSLEEVLRPPRRDTAVLTNIFSLLLSSFVSQAKWFLFLFFSVVCVC